MPFTKPQWVLWGLGLASSIVLLAAALMVKGGPSWYPPLFIGAAAYCLGAQVAIPIVKRRAPVGVVTNWVLALSTSRPGLLLLFALAVLAAALLLMRFF